MLGNLTGEATAELLSDITIDKIDFEWVEQAKKISHLKKALRLLEEDGILYKILKNYQIYSYKIIFFKVIISLI